MRLFVAIDPPQEVCEELHAWWEAACVELDAGEWRDVPPRNWHLTLAFYGDVVGDEANDLAEALAECADRTAPLALTGREMGVFPRMSRPRVFWAGVDDGDGSGRLKKLARCCRQAGHATVRKHGGQDSPFRGHVTLARARSFAGAVVPELLAAMPPLPDFAWQATHFSLYQSRLLPEGPKYRVLEEFELAG
jgi:2'-5' RNA ligase